MIANNERRQREKSIIWYFHAGLNDEHPTINMESTFYNIFYNEWKTSPKECLNLIAQVREIPQDFNHYRALQAYKQYGSKSGYILTDLDRIIEEVAEMYFNGLICRNHYVEHRFNQKGELVRIDSMEDFALERYYRIVYEYMQYYGYTVENIKYTINHPPSIF